MPKTFVLVHGAWHGGWCWARVADRLQAQGHSVYRPTLTGLGERSHLMRSGINLATHIADIANLFKFERLANVVLCGHSYGGVVVSGVAEQVAPAIGALVLLDAFLPYDGEAVETIAIPVVREAIHATVARGDGALAPRPAAAFGVNEKDCAWVDALCGPQPIGTFTEKIKLTGARERIVKRAYVRAANYANRGFEMALARAKADPGWRIYEVPSGHDVMIDMPERLTEILLEMA